MDTLTHDDCLEHGNGPCHGAVDYHITPGGYRAFPRCARHWDARLTRWETGIEREAMSPNPPAWFDPTYAGERWDEDY